MDDSGLRQTEITVFINTILLSVERHKQLLNKMSKDIQLRHAELEPADYLEIGWRLGTIDSYFSNLNSVLGLCSAIVDEPVPTFQDAGAGEPIERIQGLISYLEDVETMLNRLVTTRIEALDEMDVITDQEINDWLISTDTAQ